MSNAIFPPTVFVVDNDESARKSLGELLRGADLGVETFPSATAFLRDYAAHRPGCLVSEVHMPGMSGLELQSELHRRHIDLPVVFLTGHGDVPTAVRAMHGGAMDFIRKPADGQRILAAVRKAFRGQR